MVMMCKKTKDWDKLAVCRRCKKEFSGFGEATHIPEKELYCNKCMDIITKKNEQ